MACGRGGGLRADAKVLAFVADQPLAPLHVSEVSFAEIRFGVENVGDPVRRAELMGWLSNELRPMFGRRALPVTEDVVFRWRMLEIGRAHV